MIEENIKPKPEGLFAESAWIPKLYRLMIWMMWYWGRWLRRRGCFIRWRWNG